MKAAEDAIECRAALPADVWNEVGSGTTDFDIPRFISGQTATGPIFEDTGGDLALGEYGAEPVGILPPVA